MLLVRCFDVPCDMEHQCRAYHDRCVFMPGALVLEELARQLLPNGPIINLKCLHGVELRVLADAIFKLACCYHPPMYTATTTGMPTLVFVGLYAQLGCPASLIITIMFVMMW